VRLSLGRATTGDEVDRAAAAIAAAYEAVTRAAG
jgi:cysteine sulfinate desulfinase/cysteine desulfurase-like protein